MRGVLVCREARAVRGELEQHAAGFAEVHRLEPEPIDYFGRVAAGAFHLRAHRELMPLVVHPPGEMMDGADSPRASLRAARFPHVDYSGVIVETVARPALVSGQALESQHLGEKR